MTVSTIYAPIQYTGNGVTTVFAFPYKFYDATDLIVTLTLISSGANTVQVLNTDYTVTGGNGSTGSITMAVAPSALYRLTIEMSLPYTQGDDYVENQAFPADTLEAGLDKAAIRDQQLLSQLGRGLTFPATLSGTLVGQLPQPVNNQLLAWDGVGGSVKGVSIATLDPLPVMFTSLASGDLLTYDGTNWVNIATIDTAQIANGAVTTAKIGDGQVTTLKIADSNVTRPKLATGAVAPVNVVSSKTANYTATTDDDFIPCNATSGAFTVTLYAASGNAGREITIKKTDSSANVVTVDANSSETIDGALTVGLSRQNETLVLTCDGSNWLIKDRYISTPSSITQSAKVNPTSGTSVDFTSIPSGVKRITVLLTGISFNATFKPIIQVGYSGGVETSGYSSYAGGSFSGSATGETYSNGFLMFTGAGEAASSSVVGKLVLELMDSNTWIASGEMASSGIAGVVKCVGSKVTTGTLDRVRVTTTAGTPTFDAGSIMVTWEY